MDNREFAARQLAARLAARDWTAPSIRASLRVVLGPGQLAAKRVLIAELLAWGRGNYLPSPKQITKYLLQSAFFAPPRGAKPKLVLEPPRFVPAEAFEALDIPGLATAGELARWLKLEPPQLAWLAGLRPLAGKFRNYRYALIPKRDGIRLLEAPKTRLKAIQRRILHEILDKVPVHHAAHGFVRGRSCLTGAQIHASEHAVIAFDFSRFFPSIERRRVHGLFRSLGYPWQVARLLAGLCTTITPDEIIRGANLPRETFSTPHLPQGAPTSPALANLLAWRLDCRLDALARASSLNYTRYADDLTFSGAFEKGIGGFSKIVEQIARDEGFLLNNAKTRTMKQGTRQAVTGIVVNAHCNVPRQEFDKLKAILFNCALHGIQTQNREGHIDFRRHLEGRIAWVAQINPRKAKKLWELFDKVSEKEVLF